MVDISVVFVSYNVRVFLEQAIYAVINHAAMLNIEIIVVDNNSTDGSIDYLESAFGSNIILLKNKKNLGFAKANNQGIKIATGKYTLLLNPDTLVKSDTLIKCFEFAEKNNNIGALGVKMVDGSGHYLPESKRSIPTPANSFWKLSGVSKLFPQSKYFSAYNLGDVNENVDSKVEVLCGAFMFIPTRVLKEIGMLDEDYFMYGEDIDLSYRIGKAGYEIWYLGSNTIIHYKGQSTAKSSLSYVNTFYNAMSIFISKHFQANRAILFLMSCAIWLRSLASKMKRIFKVLLPMLIDGLGFYFGFQTIKKVWASFQFGDLDYYQSSKITYNIIIYVIIWLLVFWIGRSYRQYHAFKIYFVNFIIGLLLVLVVYSLLPLELRTSRALILLGGFWVLTFGIVIRYLTSLFSNKEKEIVKRIGIVGLKAEYERAKSIIHNSLGDQVFTTQIDANNFSSGTLKFEKEIRQLSEIVFCIKDISLDKVLTVISKNKSDVSFKIIGDKSLSIVGSKGSNELGEVYGLNLSYKLNTDANRYYKRLVDITFSIFLIILYPLLFLFRRSSLGFSFTELLKVLIGRWTLVGYHESSSSQVKLPMIKPGLIKLSPLSQSEKNNEANAHYALHYTPLRDVVILINHIF